MRYVWIRPLIQHLLCQIVIILLAAIIIIVINLLVCLIYKLNFIIEVIKTIALSSKEITYYRAIMGTHGQEHRFRIPQILQSKLTLA